VAGRRQVEYRLAGTDGHGVLSAALENALVGNHSSGCAPEEGQEDLVEHPLVADECERRGVGLGGEQFEFYHVGGHTIG